MEKRYTYIAKVSTNWVCVNEEIELDWMTKKEFDSQSWDDEMVQHEVTSELGLEWEIVDEGQGYDEPAILRTSLASIGCETEEEISDTLNEAMGGDYEQEAIMQQGISWEIVEIDNLKEIRKGKLEQIENNFTEL